MHGSTGQGARIHARRESLGLSQEKLAHLTGVTRNAVAGWESGVEPRGSTLRKIAAALDVSVHWLVTGESEPVASADNGEAA